MDKRNGKSKEAIKKALVRLSKNKLYTEISIRELCREAGLSRSTFYNNYRSCNDVIEEISADYIAQIKDKKPTREFFESLMENVDELKLLLDSGVFGRDFSQMIKEIVEERHLIRAPEEKEELSENIMTLYHGYGILGVLLNLVQHEGEPYYESFYRDGMDVLMEILEKYDLL